MSNLTVLQVVSPVSNSALGGWYRSRLKHHFLRLVMCLEMTLIGQEMYRLKWKLVAAGRRVKPNRWTHSLLVPALLNLCGHLHGSTGSMGHAYRVAIYNLKYPMLASWCS